MLPRFLKTFLFVLVLIVVPTLVLLYRNHTAGSNWNEWSLDTGSSAVKADNNSPLHLEDHWNAGGAEPDYRHTKVVEAERETKSSGESNTRIVYRVGDTLVNQEELEAFRLWRQNYHSDQGTAGSGIDEDDLTRKDSEDDGSNLASAWSSNAAVQGGVIMPKLGNATAKYALVLTSRTLRSSVFQAYPVSYFL
ncbi:hypothetical protein QFC22_002120 [Naganishia vaughanmartiniae]|uniref:Uncharacterized protein n=1 Tax=Naganishia vaughanmartiniae TaxID=1424756 RepID=A0ACC2XD10_9TREE|nr:hypothetical protein QFC22_002120 [Naganishia vaughanmartiniae]